jgi:hypothetical protein
MRKRLALMASAVLMTLALSAAFTPAANGTSITLTVYGSTGFSPTGTARVFGYQSVPDLHAYLYGNGNQGDCPSKWWRIDRPNTWYSCISSFKISGSDCHHGYTFYYDYNYHQPLLTVYGNASYSTIPGGYNDDYNSFSAFYRSTC